MRHLQCPVNYSTILVGLHNVRLPCSISIPRVSDLNQAQAPVSQVNNNASDLPGSGVARPQRQRRSTLATRAQLSEIVSGNAGGSRQRPRARIVPGKKVSLQSNTYCLFMW